MLCSITTNKKIYTSKPTQVSVRLCQCQTKNDLAKAPTQQFTYSIILCVKSITFKRFSYYPNKFLTANLQQ